MRNTWRIHELFERDVIHQIFLSGKNHVCFGEVGEYEFKKGPDPVSIFKKICTFSIFYLLTVLWPTAENKLKRGGLL